MQIFKKRSNIIISYVVITLGIALYTFAWAAFMLPARIVGGGVSGISSVLYYAVTVLFMAKVGAAHEQWRY